MITTVQCSDVRPATENDKGCVVVAYRDVPTGPREIDITDASNLTEAKERLHAQGIALGRPLQPVQMSGTPSRPASPVQIIARDEHGKQHRLIAEHVDEYSLSCGSTLYYLYVPQASCDCRWLVGRTLEIAELGSRKPDLSEPGAARDGSGDADFSATTAAQRGGGS